MRILDVGCGEGATYTFLEQAVLQAGLPICNMEYHAIDNNPEVASILNRMAVTFHLDDFNNMDSIFEEKSFDLIIASEIIEHLYDPDKFIKSIKKLLTDGGVLYLTTPNLASWHGRLMLLFGYQPLATEVSIERSEFGKGKILPKCYHVKSIMHVRVFTIRALLGFMRYHGFFVDHVWGGGYRKIDSLLFSKLFVGLSPIIKIAARKVSQ